MSASRVLSAKLLEPTTTVPASAFSPARGLSEVSPEEQPASSAAAAVSATAVAPVCLVLVRLLCAVEVIDRSNPAASRPVKNVLITDFPPRGPGAVAESRRPVPGGASSSAAAYSGGDGQASGGPEHAEGEQRQQGGQGGTADHLGVVPLVEPVDDVPAEAAETDVGGDGGRRHDLDGGRPQPAEDQRERHRQFDLEEDPRLPHAHAPGGVHRGGVDG